MLRLKSSPDVLAAFTLLALSACGGGVATSQANAANAAEASRGGDLAPPAAAATAPRATDPFAARTTTAQEQAVLAWLERNMADKRNASMYEAAVGHAVARIQACRTAQCRASAVADRRAMATFAAGKPAQVEGLPFAGGDFKRVEEGYSGVARIIPLGEGNSLLVVNLSFKGEPVCSLDGLMTSGADGSFDVSSLGDQLPGLRVEPDSPSGFTLSYADPNHQPYQVDYCTVGTSINGSYRAAA